MCERLLKSVNINKNVSYYKILEEERKDIREAWIKTIPRPVLPKSDIRGIPQLLEKAFKQNQRKSRKYFPAHQY